MPLVRVTRSIAFTDGRSYQPGDVQMTPEQAQEATQGGWGHLVREQPPETPERARAQHEHAAVTTPARGPRSTGRAKRRAS